MRWLERLGATVFWTWLALLVLLLPVALIGAFLWPPALELADDGTSVVVWVGGGGLVVGGVAVVALPAVWWFELSRSRHRQQR